MLVVALGVVSGCGGGDSEESETAFCDAVDEMADYLDDYGGVPTDMDELESAMADIRAIERDVRGLAPDSIRDDVRIVFTADSDTRDLDEQEELAEARRRVNDYIAEECRLDVGL